MSWAYDCCVASRFLLAAVFTVSVASKVHSRAAWRSFRAWLTGVPFRPLGLKGTPAALVTAEAAVVALVVAVPLAGLIAGSALTLALTAGLAIVVRRGSRQPCHCFGASSEPLSRQHVIRNALLLALAVTGSVGAVAAGHQPGGPAQTVLAAIEGLTAALLIIFFADVAALFRPAAASSRHPAAQGTGSR